MKTYDVIVIGAGAAGLYCAGLLGQRGLRVLVLDHARRIAEKIRISGGGRCNFTNLHGGDPARYLSGNPRFVRHALKVHPPAHFIARVKAARIGFHEKHLGQLFCNESSQQIIDMLLADCKRGKVRIEYPVKVLDVRRMGRGEPGIAAEHAHRQGAESAHEPFRNQNADALSDSAQANEEGDAGDSFVDPSGSDQAAGFVVPTSIGEFESRQLVIATGGLSIPAIGASDHAWKLAERWGLKTVPPRAGLVPLTLTSAAWQPFAQLSGVALPVAISVLPQEADTKCAAVTGATRKIDSPGASIRDGDSGSDSHPGQSRITEDLGGGAPGAANDRGKGKGPGAGKRVRNRQMSPSFEEDLLFTHRGLSGPAALQISSYWQPGQTLLIDLLPQLRAADQLLVDLKAGRMQAVPDSVAALLSGQPHRQQLGTVLSALLPERLVKVWLEAAPAMLPPAFASLQGLSASTRLAEIGDARLRLLGQALKKWPVVPAGSEGYRKAEVTVGGLDTDELDPRTMQAHRVPGSFWIGEAVDVTGWLGGYNFQWAWASAFVAADAMAAQAKKG